MPTPPQRARSHAESATGDRSRWIWPFELLERIGEGGMGHVYRARYVPRNLEVAVKMVPEDVSDGTTLARFEREMEVLKELKHPNIVRTFGGVSETKQRFYAMELMPGGTVEDELTEKGKLPWERVVEYGLQMCAALEFLHAKGVVHRDVKPSNFLKGNDGRIKLSDFGLASVIADRKITAEGRTAGTFLYMAPEQIRGEQVIPQTDLYALGCVFFELLSGKPPLIGDTPAATLHKHCKQTPPRVTEFALDCPLSLERLVARLLEKDSTHRPASAAEVARELRNVSQQVEVVAPRGKDLTAGVGNDLVRGRDVSTESRTQVAFSSVSPAPQVADKNLTKYGLGAAVIGLLLIGWIVRLYSAMSPGESALELWRTTMTSPVPAVRARAADAIGQLADKPGLALLAEGLKTDTEPSVREACALGLGRASSAAAEYVPMLMRVRNEDESQEVRMAADKALKQIQN
ncbi:MAG: protein kinase domain-containing protein [Planctomycetaceae bacterium]